MQRQNQIQYAEIPAWAIEGKTASIYTFFEAIALAGLENKKIKLSSAMQRKLLGCVVFGRRPITVLDNAMIQCTVDVCFGQDWETAEWTADTVRRAAEAGKQLCPKRSGPGYFSEQRLS